MMELRHLLELARPALDRRLADDPVIAHDAAHPACILFLVVSNGQERALVDIATAGNWDQAWQDGADRLAQAVQQWQVGPIWLRAEAVHHIETLSWARLRAIFGRTKRNYFRYGIALDAEFSTAMLEHEIYANALLYDNQIGVCQPNSANLRAYGVRRFGRPLRWPQQDAQRIWRFKTRAVFTDGAQVHDIEHAGHNSGYRQVTDWGPVAVRRAIDSSTAYLADQIQASGRYHYGWFPCFDRAIPTYNALRHASSTYALLEGWELDRRQDQCDAIERALQYLADTLIQTVTLKAGAAAFLVDTGNEVKLGGNAVCLLAFVKYTELTGNRKYVPLLEKLALGILHMQSADGSFVHVLEFPALTLKERHRIIYYDGEAAFGLMRLYGLTKDARWLAAVEQAFDYFISARHWEAHDHWLSYCVNELTRYRPEEKYFRFGLDNVRDYLDFVLYRITTYPTLLELMMAARQMIERIQSDPGMAHLLDGFDLARFHRALEHRARYLLNGFFWPELAMFFKNPARIVGSFFIRHHTFRVRIDDVEHYLSGYVAYLKHLEQTARSASGTRSAGKKGATALPEDAQPCVAVPPPAGPTVVWGGDVNLGRRQHYRAAHFGHDAVLAVPALKEADLGIVNLECVVATCGEQGVDKGEGGSYYYRARPEMLRILQHAGVDVVSTANNHAGDYGPEALMEQAAWLDAAAIGHAGSGASADAAFAPVFGRAGQLVVAVFGLDTTQHRFAAHDDRPGTAYLSPDDPGRIREIMTLRIRQARQAAHVVMVALHCGDNMATAPQERDRKVARALIDAGADAVLGASAHLLQGIEVYQGRPIVHDAGDLLFDSVRQRHVGSGVFRLELGPEGVRRVVFIPVGVGFGQTTQLQGEAAMAVLSEYVDRCRQVGTHLTSTAQGAGFIDLAPPDRQSTPSTVIEPMQAAVPQPDAMAHAARWTVEAVPEDARIDAIQLGPLTLLGMRVHPTVFKQRRMLWVESFWSAQAPVDEDVRLDIQAVPVTENGMRPWGHGMDHDPCDWMMPTSRWTPGVIYRDFYGLRPPYLKDWKNGVLQLFAGIAGASRPVPPVALPFLARLAVPGKDAVVATRQATPVYRSNFPEALLVSEPGKTWTAEQLQQITGGTWLQPPPRGWYVRSVVAGAKHIDMLPGPVLFVGHDSRDRQRHEQGKIVVRNFDRHVFIARHQERLAGAIVSQTVPGLAPDFPLLFVPDPLKAMIELGIAARQRYRGPVIAVTGTVGKSTTVDMIGRLLGGQGRVLVSIDNYNSRVGVPALLASLSADHEAAVVEIAQSALWMQRGPITRVIRPTIAVITEIGLSQTDAMVKTIEDAVRWKTRIFDGLTGAAVAIVGEHLPCFEQVLQRARQHARQVIVFGYGKDCTVRIETIRADETGSTVRLILPDGETRLHIPIPGQGAVKSVVAACCVMYALGRDPAGYADAVAQFQTLHGRMQAFDAMLSGRRVRVIDDSFNATVLSMLNAFSVLKSATAQHRKVAVLGRIVHLGEMALDLHRSLAGPLCETGAALVVTHGEEMLALREVLPQEILGPHFSDAPTLAAYLEDTLQEGDVVLLKGSRRDSDFGAVGPLLRRHAYSANRRLVDAIFQDAQPARAAPVNSRRLREQFGHAAAQVGWSVVSERKADFGLADAAGKLREVFHRGNVGASVVTAATTANRLVARAVLMRCGLPVPVAEIFKDSAQALRYCQERQDALILKADKGGGKVCLDSIEPASFAQAWERVGGKRVLVESRQEGDVVHCLSIGATVVAAYCTVRQDGARETAVSVAPLLHPETIALVARAAAALPGAAMLGWELVVRDFTAPPEAGNVTICDVTSRPDLLLAGDAVGTRMTEDIPLAVMRWLSGASRDASVGYDGQACVDAAPAYLPGCGGDSFPRNYGTQVRLIRQAAYARNLLVEMIGSQLTVLRDARGRQIAFSEGMSSKTRAVSRRASNDKAWTKMLLERAGIATPDGRVFAVDQADAAWEFIRAARRPMVIKPISGSGGTGVSTQVSTRPHFDAAWSVATATGVRRILCETFVAGNDYRVMVIGHRICAVTQRIPAHVVGDGVHTIQELVAQKNQARKANPYTGAKAITISKMMLRNLQQIGMVETSVPAKGRVVQLHTVANIGSGGDSRDVTDSVHPAWAEVAVRARVALYDAAHIGLDLIAEDISRPPEAQSWTVIEVNTNPDLGMQHFPVDGMARDIAGALLDDLFDRQPDALPEKVCVRAEIRVRGESEGLQKWIWQAAHLHALHGWVRSMEDAHMVEAVFSGPANTVRQMLDKCSAGPPMVRIQSISSASFAGSVEPTFRMHA